MRQSVFAHLSHESFFKFNALSRPRKTICLHLSLIAWKEERVYFFFQSTNRFWICTASQCSSKRTTKAPIMRNNEFRLRTLCDLQKVRFLVKIESGNFR